MSEKRKYMRFNVFLDALCRIGDTLNRLKVNDFSREGAGLLSRDYIPAGENIEIELNIPGDNIPITIMGEIVWTRDVAHGDTPHKCGLKIKKIANSDRNRILDHIYKKMEGR
jgi:hypothetical protein